MKRIIDYDALWSSDRVEKCKPEFRYEYAWLYGLADARGSFELTTTHKIHHRVAAIRPDLTIQKLEDVLAEFERVGLLFTWEAQGKRWGHWVGSTNPGRLPSQSKLDRSHYKVVAPSVPLVELKACCEERDIHLSHWPEDGEGEPEKVAEIVTGENSRAFTDYAVAQFEAKFGRKPAWQKHEYIGFNRLHKKLKFSLENFKAVWDAYMADDSAFVKDEQGHSLSWLCRKFDAYAAKAGAGQSSGPSEAEKRQLRDDADRQAGELKKKRSKQAAEVAENEKAAEAFLDGGNGTDSIGG